MFFILKMHFAIIPYKHVRKRMIHNIAVCHLYDTRKDKSFYLFYEFLEFVWSMYRLFRRDIDSFTLLKMQYFLNSPFLLWVYRVWLTSIGATVDIIVRLFIKFFHYFVVMFYYIKLRKMVTHLSKTHQL